jgi:hypothetical protein
MLLDRIHAAGLLLPERVRPPPEPRFSRPLAAHADDAAGPVLLLHARQRLCAGIDSAIVATAEPEPELELGAALRMVAEQVNCELQEAIAARARRCTAMIRDAAANGLAESTAESRVCSLISVLLEQLGVLREALLPHTDAAEVTSAAAAVAQAERARLSARCKELGEQREALEAQIASQAVELEQVTASIASHGTHAQPGSAELLPTLMRRRDDLTQSVYEARKAYDALIDTLVNEEFLSGTAMEQAEIAEAAAAAAWRSAHEEVCASWAQQLRHLPKLCTLDGAPRIKRETAEICCGAGRVILPHGLATTPALVSGWGELTPLSASLPYHHGVTDTARLALFSGGVRGTFATVGPSDSSRVSIVLGACAATAIDARVVDGTNHAAGLRAAEALMREVTHPESAVGEGPREIVARPWPLCSLLLVDDADHLPAETIDLLAAAARTTTDALDGWAGPEHPLPCVLCLCWSEASLADQPESVAAALERAVPEGTGWRISTHGVPSASHRFGGFAPNATTMSATASSGTASALGQHYRSRRQLELLHALALEGFSYYEALSRALDEALPQTLSPARAPCRDVLICAGAVLRAMNLPDVEGTKGTGRGWDILAKQVGAGAKRLATACLPLPSCWLRWSVGLV